MCVCAGASDGTLLNEPARADIMLYNEDRSMIGFVSPAETGARRVI